MVQNGYSTLLFGAANGAFKSCLFRLFGSWLQDHLLQSYLCIGSETCTSHCTDLRQCIGMWGVTGREGVSVCVFFDVFEGWFQYQQHPKTSSPWSWTNSPFSTEKKQTRRARHWNKSMLPWGPSLPFGSWGGSMKRVSCLRVVVT